MANLDRNSLINSLLRPQIAQFITRTPSRNNSNAYARNHSRASYSPVPNAAANPPPVQFQNQFRQSRPNTMMTPQRPLSVQSRPNGVTVQRVVQTRPISSFSKVYTQPTSSSNVQMRPNSSTNVRMRPNSSSNVQQATLSQRQQMWRPKSDR